MHYMIAVSLEMSDEPYISNAVTYRDFARKDYTYAKRGTLAEMSDPILMPLLSPVGMEILLDGAQHSRAEKTANIANLSLAQRHLNVCVNYDDSHVEATNCSRCAKCMRTLMALESANALREFSGVFDMGVWKKLSFRYKCHQVFRYSTDSFAQDNVDFARKQGNSLPSKPVAYFVVGCSIIKHFPGRVVRKLRKMMRNE